MTRLWTAYRAELFKARSRKLPWAGPALVVGAVIALGAAWWRGPAPDPYLFLAQATVTAVDLLGQLFLLLFCAGLVASELGSGTARLVLVRPLRRGDFLAAKLLLGWTCAALLLVCAAAAAWAVAWHQGGLEGVQFGGETVYTRMEMIEAYFIALALGWFPLAAAAAYAVFVSCCTRSAATAVSVAVGLWVAVEALKHPLGLAPWLFTTYTDQPWQVFNDRAMALDAPWMPLAGHTLLASMTAIAVFSALAWLILRCRDLRP